MFSEFDAFMFGPYGISVIDDLDKQFEALEKFVVEQEKKSNPFGIQCVQSNHEKGVFTVKWTDGTVTMVSCQPGDDWDDEKALAMCFMKKALGNKGSFNDVMRDALKKMAVIPAKKKAIPAVEVAPTQAKADADFSEAMKKLENTAAEAGKGMKEAISKLLNENNKTFKEKRRYDVYVVEKGNESLLGANLIKHMTQPAIQGEIIQMVSCAVVKLFNKALRISSFSKGRTQTSASSCFQFFPAFPKYSPNCFCRVIIF